MQVRVTGRHMGVGESLKQYCEEKAGKLVHFFDKIQSIDVVIDGKAGSHAAEIIVHTDHHTPFVAHEQHSDAFAAIDLTLDKIEEQLRRHKERLRNRKHPPRSGHDQE